jgi:hypothetical protein
MSLRPCDYCGGIFDAQRHWQRFCCTAHRVAAHRDQQRLILEAAARAGITSDNAHTIKKGLEDAKN